MILWHVVSKYALGFIALAGIIGVFGAVSAGRLVLAGVVAVVTVIGIPLAYRMKRLRRSLDQPLPPGKP